MKVVITGGAGYIGSKLAGSLLWAGMDVTVFDSLMFGAEPLLMLRGVPGFALVKGDVRRQWELEAALEGADAVIHLAALVGEAACDPDPDCSWEVNYGGTGNCLAAAERQGVERMIFLSTCSNYGISQADALADEQDPLRPLSLYAKTKVAAEKMILAQKAVPAVLLRLGTICGLSARMRFDLLVSELALAAVLDRPISIYSPGAWRPFLHIMDAVDAIKLCLARPVSEPAGKVYNVVGENVQKSDLVQMVRRQFPAARIKVTDRTSDLRDYRVDGSAVGRELGFSPRLTVADAFRETVEAVSSGVFRDPTWEGHSAVPPDKGRAACRTQ